MLPLVLQQRSYDMSNPQTPQIRVGLSSADEENGLSRHVGHREGGANLERGEEG